MLRVLFFVLLTSVYAVILAVPVEWLWNRFLPGAFQPLVHVPLLGFWQAVGVVVAARLLHVLRLSGFLFGTLLWALLGGWCLQWAWNAWLVPGFHLAPLAWLQAGAMLALLHLLFGSAGWFFHARGNMQRVFLRGQARERRREERHRRREEWKRWKREMKADLHGWSCGDGSEWSRVRPWSGLADFKAFWEETGEASYRAWKDRRDRDDSAT